MRKLFLALFVYLLASVPANAESNLFHKGWLATESPVLIPTATFFTRLWDGCKDEGALLEVNRCRMQVGRVATLAARIQWSLLLYTLKQCDEACAMAQLSMHYFLIAETKILLLHHPHLVLAVLPEA